MKLIGYASEEVLSKALTAQDTGEPVFFNVRSHASEKCVAPFYIGTEAMEAQKQRTAAIVAHQQLKKLYVELTNGDPVGDDFGDGEYSHKGYLITNEQLERMRELLGIEQ